MTTVREPEATTLADHCRADQLAVGQMLAPAQLITGRPTEVVFVDTHPQGSRQETLIVHRPLGADFVVPSTVDAEMTFRLATDAEVAEVKQTAERAKFIAGLHEFADWLKANPWAPIDRTGGYISKALLQVDLYGNDMAADADAATVARVREIADRSGVNVRELPDRTQAEIGIGSFSYSVIAWHKDGRPAEPKPLVDPDASMEAHYDAETDARAYLGEMHAKAAEVRAARADASQIGLGHSRADDPPVEADLTRKGRDLLSIAPVSPARVSPHAGNWVSKVADQAGA